MIANYHTHTPRCRHANGSEEAYIQNAIDGGLEILGFSDHTPYWFPNGYYTHMRMFPEELGEYVETIHRLKSQYADQIQIYVGLEVEYYPRYFPELMEHLRQYDIEYMILGQHWLGSEIGEPYSGSADIGERELARYCDQVIEAMHTGLFTYVAHPDLIRYTGDDKIYTQHMGKLCREAKACGMPLEINLWGLQTNRYYPSHRFWEVAAQEGCDAIIGSDAHEPWTVNNVEKERIALEIVDRFGLRLLDKVTLRAIG